MKNQKGNIVLVVLIAVAFVLGGLLLYHKMINRLFVTPTSQSSAQAEIQTDADLQAVSTDLDNTNLDTIDIVLNQNSQDAMSF